MGHRNGWDSKENKIFGLAWLSACEDPIIGTNKNTKQFVNAMFHYFFTQGLYKANTLEGHYSMRAMNGSISQFDEFSGDCQKFSTSLRKIREYKPTR